MSFFIVVFFEKCEILCAGFEFELTRLVDLKLTGGFDELLIQRLSIHKRKEDLVGDLKSEVQ